MSRPSPFKLMIKNWKTSSIVVPAFSFSLWYTYDYTSTHALMKSSCRRAAAYGDENIRNPNAPTRHITVILNPAAGKGKSKKLYEKWVEPILHLAGIKVSLVETRSPKEAFELMKIMTNCDGVAIVGGDGTVHDALNGLLQRPDRAKAASDFPIGIIPTGQYNSIARYLHQDYVSYRNQKEFLIGATVKIIDNTTTKFDAIKMTTVDEEISKTESPTYALRDIRYGFYQDNFYKLSGYHYYQTLIKPVWQRLQRIFSSKYAQPQIESVSFTEPCDGCKNCFERHKLQNDVSPQTPTESGTNRRWWSMIVPVNQNRSGPTDEEKRELELSKRENPDCGRWINVEKPQDISDFRACMMGDKKVRLSLGRKREYTASDITETQDVRLVVKPELDVSYRKGKELSSDLIERETNEENNIGQQPMKKNNDKADKPVEFLVDGQPSQVHSVEITALSNAVTVFTGPYKMYVAKG